MRVISNTSLWRTDDVMRIGRRIAAYELDDAHRKRVTIKIVPSRYFVGGRASLGGDQMTIKLPTHRSVDLVALAMVFAHEFAHLRGMTHQQMLKSPRYTWTNGYREVYAWAKDYTLRRKNAPALGIAATTQPANDGVVQG